MSLPIIRVRHVCGDVCDYVAPPRLVVRANLRSIRRVLMQLLCPACKLEVMERTHPIRRSPARVAEDADIAMRTAEAGFSEDSDQT